MRIDTQAEFGDEARVGGRLDAAVRAIGVPQDTERRDENDGKGQRKTRLGTFGHTDKFVCIYTNNAA
jgi:hypothetical protein